MGDESDYPWWKAAVIYQIYPRSFLDSNGDGIGDLEGIIQKLDYLTLVLGVDAIWISPFYPSPMADFGYDISNFKDIDPRFGDLDVFDRLLASAHGRGLKVLLDFVPNHTSYQHPWFEQSRSSRSHPRREWYVWADPESGGLPPNNWLSIFGGSAWEWDAFTGQYYLHSFLKEQPDLNWRNPEVKDAMFDVVRFWLEKGVDGFRVDAPHYIMKDPRLRDNPKNPNPGSRYYRSRGPYDGQVHVHDKNHPDCHSIYRAIRNLLDEYSQDNPRLLAGELYIFDPEEWVAYYGRDLDEFHLPFDFTLLNSPWKAQAIRQAVDSLEFRLPRGAWPSRVLGNHDEPRLSSRIGPAQSRVAAVLLLTLPGTPVLYYGDELGMTDHIVSREHQQDHWGWTLPGLGRDPTRTPMQWNAEAGAGFSTASPDRFWLPLNPNHKSVNVSAQLEDSASLLNLYRRLLALRRESKALRFGSYRPIDQISRDCFVYVRTFNQERNLIALNFSNREQDLSLGEKMPLRILLSTDPERRVTDPGHLIRLAANEGLILG